jgi:hypothetical protein
MPCHFLFFLIRKKRKRRSGIWDLGFLQMGWCPCMRFDLAQGRRRRRRR